MAIQLLVLLGVAAWLGQKIDKKLATAIPWFTILFVLLFTFGFFYKLVKELSRNDEP